MKTFAHITDGAVFELLDIEDDRGIYDFFPESMLWVEVTLLDPRPEQRWLYDGSNFSPPKPAVRTPEEILATNTAYRDAALATAATAIAPLQDAADLDDATPSELALLKKWKQYRVAVNRVDLALSDPAWPVAPA